MINSSMICIENNILFDELYECLNIYLFMKDL